MFIQAQMQSMVRPNATVAIGYCFGGSAVLDLAASWPSMTDGVQGQPCKTVICACTYTQSIFYAVSQSPCAQCHSHLVHNVTISRLRLAAAPSAYVYAA